MAFCAWGEEDIFRVMVSSSFIAGSGGSIATKRPKAAGEVRNSEELDVILEQAKSKEDAEAEEFE